MQLLAELVKATGRHLLYTPKGERVALTTGSARSAGPVAKPQHHGFRRPVKGLASPIEPTERSGPYGWSKPATSMLFAVHLTNLTRLSAS